MNTPPRPINQDEQATPVAEWSPINTPHAKQNDRDGALTQPMPSVGVDSAKTIPMDDFDGHSSPATPAIGSDGNVIIVPDDEVRQRLDFNEVDDPDMPALERPGAVNVAPVANAEQGANMVKAEPGNLVKQEVKAEDILPIAANDQPSVGIKREEPEGLTQNSDTKRIKKGGFYYKYCKYKNKYANLLKNLTI